MARSGPGNLEDDLVWDFVMSSLVAPLRERIRELAEKPAALHPEEHPFNIGIASLEILTALSSELGVVLLPSPSEVDLPALRRRIDAAWDSVTPKSTSSRDRRQVVARTLSKAIRAVEREFPSKAAEGGSVEDLIAAEKAKAKAKRTSAVVAQKAKPRSKLADASNGSSGGARKGHVDRSSGKPLRPSGGGKRGKKRRP